MERLEKNLDELNIERREAMRQLSQRDEEKDKQEQDEALTIAERMIRRAISNTFTMTFRDEKNEDEITIEFRMLFSEERRRMLEMIQDVQGLKPSETDQLNRVMDSFKDLIKQVTVTEGMDAYYDSEYCQDADIFEIAASLLQTSVNMLEDARRFR